MSVAVQTQSVRSLVIAGDTRTEWLLVKSGLPVSPTAQFVPQAGGAWLLARLCAEMVGQGATKERPQSPTTDRPDVVLELESYASVSAHGVVAPQPSLRVGRMLRIKDNADAALDPIAVDGVAPRVGVIDDMAMAFRDRMPPFALDDVEHIVVSTRWPIGGALWTALDGYAKKGRPLTIVLNASYLRAAGVRICRGLSWQRTVRELLDNLPPEPFAASADVIIRFGHEAALHWRPRQREWKLFFFPDLPEDYCKRVNRGDMIGAHSVFTAGIATAIAASNSLSDRLKTCLTWAFNWHASGFGSEESQAAYPFDHLNGWLKEPAEKSIQAVAIDEKKRGETLFLLSDLHDSEKRRELAAAIVKSGQSTVRPLPKAVFNKVMWVDPREVEGYRHIAALIDEYLKRVDSRKPRPLSIAVFGPPGAGKSFGITTVAKTLGALRPLDFNLSQWDAADRLVTAFHKMREISITGDVPLVFFDEFDAALGGRELGWLKYFLAPMQDGKFRDQDSEYSLGTSVLVFAGSTSRSFAEFQARCLRDDPEIKAAKCRDFVSRLRGHMTVLGPTAAGMDDDLAIIRRALILRDNLERKAGQLVVDKRMNVDDAVLTFLLDADYIHGARSIEAIIDMSQLAGKNLFGLADLPPVEQLDLHVKRAQG